MQIITDRSIDDIYDFFEDKGYITGSQLDVLEKIYYENNVKEFTEETLGHD